MSSTAELLAIVRVATAAIMAAQSVGVNTAQLVEKAERARAEGRDLTFDELQEFADRAQAGLDRLKPE